MGTEIIKNIRTTLAEGYLDKAIEFLWKNYGKNEYKDDIISLRRRFQEHNEKSLKGLLYRQDEVVEKNQISYTLLQILNKIEEKITDATLENLDNKKDNKSIIRNLLEVIKESTKGFQGQSKIRNLLAGNMKRRLSITESLQYEDFFKKYYPEMDDEDLGYHYTIRDYTQNVLNKYNRKALELIFANQSILKEIPRLKELERHLLVWLGKYESRFHQTPSISIVYVGVKEKVPFPAGIERELEEYLAKQ